MHQKALIIGGGPVGMYTALKLLDVNPECRVKVIEKRSAVYRPQTVRLPFSAINALPEEVKEQLWPNDETRKWTLGDRLKSDVGFWPHSDCKYAIVSEIGEFQKVIKNYLEFKYDEKRFEFVINEDLSVEYLKKNLGDFDVVIIAAGNGELTQKLRRVMNISSAVTDYYEREEVDRRGVYLIYETDNHESYERFGKLLMGAEKSARGITYSHANDSAHHVQIYTYPVGELREIHARMPESFKRTAAFSASNYPLTFDGKKAGENALTSEEKRWFDTFAPTLKKTILDSKIPFPADDKVRVYFGPRYDYYYKVAGKTLLNVPVLFIGDACGGTDYKLGFSLGRGLITARELSDRMKAERKFAFPGLVEFHNKNWKHVIATEFNQSQAFPVNKTAHLNFKYWMEDRTVDGKPIDREMFLKEFNQPLQKS